eukprot:158083_1
MSERTTLNHSETIFYVSIPILILIYSTAIFTIVQFIKFIKCTEINFNNPFFQSRHSKLNLLYISLFLLVLYIINPLTLILCNFNVHKSIPLIINDTSNNIIFLCFFTRSWVFCFDRHFVDSLKNWIWRREINTHEAETNIFIKYRDILSPHRRLIITIFYIICITPILIILLLLSDFNIIHHIIYRIIYTIILIILLISTYYLINHKMSIITDEYGIREELLYSIKSSGILYVTSHILYIILWSYVNSQIAMFIEILILCIANSFVIYFSCYWTRKKFIYESISKLNTSNGKRRRSFLNIFTQKQNISFDDIMNHRSGIELFCHQLANEFGLESILFLIEVCQFKAKINQKYKHFTGNVHLHKIMSSHNKIFSALNILNITWMPIDARMNTYSPYKIALYLYDKYIESSADLCINISSPNRREIYRTFKDLAVTLSEEHSRECEQDIIITLYKLFDNAYIGIWHLIQTDAFIRFKSSSQFNRLIYVLYPKKAKQALVESQNILLKNNSQTEKEQKTEPKFTQIPVRSISPTIEIEIEIGEIEMEEKKSESELKLQHMRSNSVPASSESLFPLSAADDKLQMTSHTQRNTFNPMFDHFNDISDHIIVPTDIIKTAGDFWNNYISPLPQTEKLEIGVALYLSMIASDRTMQYMFKKHHNIQQKQIEKLSLKFLHMIGWLIQLLWNRNNNQLHISLNKLGNVHQKLKIKIIHFHAMLNMLHETLKFYF